MVVSEIIDRSLFWKRSRVFVELGGENREFSVVYIEFEFIVSFFGNMIEERVES